MADLVYRSVMRDIKQKILDNEYPGMRLQIAEVRIAASIPVLIDDILITYHISHLQRRILLSGFVSPGVLRY